MRQFSKGSNNPLRRKRTQEGGAQGLISLPQPAPASPEGARCSCRSTGCGGDSPLESQGPCLQLCRPRQHSKNLDVLPEKNREKGHDNNFKCVGAAGEEKRGSVPVPRLSRARHRGLPAAGRLGITRAIDEERERERERQRRDRPAGWARVSLSCRQKCARARTARGGLVLPRGRRWTGQPRCGQTDRQQRSAGAHGRLSPQRGSYVSTGQEHTGVTPRQIHSTVLRRGTMVSTAARWLQPVCWGTSAAGTLRSCRSSIRVLRGKRGDEEEELGSIRLMGSVG